MGSLFLSQLKFTMGRYILLFSLITGLGVLGQAQDMDTLGISNGSVHMKGTFKYTKFFKKYKGDSDLTVHVWYNPTSSSKSTKEIKPGKNEVYFLYGRNLRTGLSEMDFVFGSEAQKVFAKKSKEWVEFIDFIQFDVFPNQHFNGDSAMEALEKVFE
jgi:hypothetical protein